jgi:hypothetical protein
VLKRHCYTLEHLTDAEDILRDPDAYVDVRFYRFPLKTRRRFLVEVGDQYTAKSKQCRRIVEKRAKIKAALKAHVIWKNEQWVQHSKNRRKEIIRSVEVELKEGKIYRKHFSGCSEDLR